MASALLRTNTLRVMDITYLLLNSGEPNSNPAIMPTFGERLGSSNLLCVIFGSSNCAAIVSCVCLDTSPANKEFSSSASVCSTSAGGFGPSTVCKSDCTPRIFPLASDSAKFIRPSSADELTQVSAFIEYPVGGCIP